MDKAQNDADIYGEMEEQRVTPSVTDRSDRVRPLQSDEGSGSGSEGGDGSLPSCTSCKATIQVAGSGNSSAHGHDDGLLTPDNLQGMKTEPKNSVSQVDLEGREELDLDSGYDRPEVEHDNEKEVQRSYATVKLLVNQYPSPQLQRFLDAKAKCIASELFKVCWSCAKGSFRHSCCVLDYLLQNYTDQVYEAIGHSNTTVERHLGPAMNFLTLPGVADTMFLKLVLKPSPIAPGIENDLAKDRQPCVLSPSLRWRLLSNLSDWRIILRIARPVFSLDSSSVYSGVCADLFLQMVYGLCWDDNGELLLQPVGHCPELCNGLIDMACNQERPQMRRTDAARVLLGLVTKVSEDEIPLPLPLPGTGVMFSMPQPTVKNSMASMRHLVLNLFTGRLKDLLRAVMEESTATENGHFQPVSHPGFTVKRPFSVLRYLLVSIVTQIVLIDRSQLDGLPLELWRCLCGWFYAYPNNSLFLSTFYRLMFMVIRNHHEVSLRAIFCKCKFIASCINYYKSDGTDVGLRGHIVQAESLPPSAFLRNFLQSHDGWRSFQSHLCEETLKQQLPGLGFHVPLSGLDGLGKGLYSIDAASSLSCIEDDGIIGGIDHGSDFATSLGFEGDVAWPKDQKSGSSKKKKKKKKKTGTQKNLLAFGESLCQATVLDKE